MTTIRQEVSEIYVARRGSIPEWRGCISNTILLLCTHPYALPHTTNTHTRTRTQPSTDLLDLKQGDIFKLVGAAYKALSPEMKASYETRAAEQKRSYNEAIAAQREAAGSSGDRASSISKSNTSSGKIPVKKARSAFDFYLADCERAQRDKTQEHVEGHNDADEGSNPNPGLGDDDDDDDHAMERERLKRFRESCEDAFKQLSSEEMSR